MHSRFCINIFIHSSSVSSCRLLFHRTFRKPGCEGLSPLAQPLRISRSLWHPPRASHVGTSRPQSDLGKAGRGWNGREAGGRSQTLTPISQKWHLRPSRLEEQDGEPPRCKSEEPPGQIGRDLFLCPVVWTGDHLLETSRRTNNLSGWVTASKPRQPRV